MIDLFDEKFDQSLGRAVCLFTLVKEVFVSEVTRKDRWEGSEYVSPLKMVDVGTLSTEIVHYVR